MMRKKTVSVVESVEELITALQERYDKKDLWLEVNHGFLA